jgi:hypothetical protein
MGLFGKNPGYQPPGMKPGWDKAGVKRDERTLGQKWGDERWGRNYEPKVGYDGALLAPVVSYASTYQSGGPVGECTTSSSSSGLDTSSSSSACSSDFSSSSGTSGSAE